MCLVVWWLLPQAFFLVNFFLKYVLAFAFEWLFRSSVLRLVRARWEESVKVSVLELQNRSHLQVRFQCDDDLQLFYWWRGNKTPLHWLLSGHHAGRWLGDDVQSCGLIFWSIGGNTCGEGTATVSPVVQNYAFLILLEASGYAVAFGLDQGTDLLCCLWMCVYTPPMYMHTHAHMQICL